MDAPAVFGGKCGRQRLAPVTGILRHRHNTAYAAIVLSGNFEEAGNAGRFFARAGNVIIHNMFDCHLDRVGGAGADVLNLPLDGLRFIGRTMGRIADPDAIARRAEWDGASALRMMAEQWQTVQSPSEDWADDLRSALETNTSLRLDDWARHEGLAAETLSRAFHKLYGITPASFRVEARARAAWRRIVAENTPLAAIACECGFADQAHMTRAVRALSDASPSDWRRSNSFKTGPHPSA
jgi:AraC-like DNA-binding protein